MLKQSFIEFEFLVLHLFRLAKNFMYDTVELVNNIMPVSMNNPPIPMFYYAINVGPGVYQLNFTLVTSNNTATNTMGLPSAQLVVNGMNIGDSILLPLNINQNEFPSAAFTSIFQATQPSNMVYVNYINSNADPTNVYYYYRAQLGVVRIANLP